MVEGAEAALMAGSLCPSATARRPPPDLCPFPPTATDPSPATTAPSPPAAAAATVLLLGGSREGGLMTARKGTVLAAKTVGRQCLCLTCRGPAVSMPPPPAPAAPPAHRHSSGFFETKRPFGLDTMVVNRYAHMATPPTQCNVFGRRPATDTAERLVADRFCELLLHRRQLGRRLPARPLLGRQPVESGATVSGSESQ